MVKIEHLAIYVSDLEAMKDWYCDLFQLSDGTRYENPLKGFSSYFLTSPEGGARIELMHSTHLQASGKDRDYRPGYHHFAFSLGSKTAVDELTKQCSAAGISVLDGPRTTGDGYYESVITDPEGNRIELTI